MAEDTQSDRERNGPGGSKGGRGEDHLGRPGGSSSLRGEGRESLLGTVGLVGAPASPSVDSPLAHRECSQEESRPAAHLPDCQPCLPPCLPPPRLSCPPPCLPPCLPPPARLSFYPTLWLTRYAARKSPALPPPPQQWTTTCEECGKCGGKCVWGNNGGNEA